MGVAFILLGLNPSNLSQPVHLRMLPMVLHHLPLPIVRTDTSVSLFLDFYGSADWNGAFLVCCATSSILQWLLEGATAFRTCAKLHVSLSHGTHRLTALRHKYATVPCLYCIYRPPWMTQKVFQQTDVVDVSLGASGLRYWHAYATHNPPYEVCMY